MSCHLGLYLFIKCSDSPADVLSCARPQVDYIACPFLASLDVNIGHEYIFNDNKKSCYDGQCQPRWWRWQWGWLRSPTNIHLTIVRFGPTTAVQLCSLTAPSHCHVSQTSHRQQLAPIWWHDHHQLQPAIYLSLIYEANTAVIVASVLYYLHNKQNIRDFFYFDVVCIEYTV